MKIKEIIDFIREEEQDLILDLLLKISPEKLTKMILLHDNKEELSWRFQELKQTIKHKEINL